jgi:hypothetical protein
MGFRDTLCVSSRTIYLSSVVLGIRKQTGVGEKGRMGVRFRRILGCTVPLSLVVTEGRAEKPTREGGHTAVGLGGGDVSAQKATVRPYLMRGRDNFLRENWVAT